MKKILTFMTVFLSLQLFADINIIPSSIEGTALDMGDKYISIINPEMNIPGKGKLKFYAKLDTAKFICHKIGRSFVGFDFNNQPRENVISMVDGTNLSVVNTNIYITFVTCK